MDQTLSRSGRKAPRLGLGRRLWRCAPVLHILCGLALLLVASIHQPPQAPGTASGFDLAEFVLPDGTIPDLCLTGDGGDDRGSALLHRHGCEACRLTALPDLLPPAGDLFVPAEYHRLAFIRLDDAGPPLNPPRYRAPPRAPPVSDIAA